MAMNSESFDIDIPFEGKKLHGTCSIYTHSEPQTEMPYDKPVYRVALNTHTAKPHVYLFYKVDEPQRKFIWYKEEFNSLKNSIYKAIEIVLNELP